MQSVAPQLRGIDLKAERVRSGLTQRELGERLGVSARRVANVEALYRPAPAIVRALIEAQAAADKRKAVAESHDPATAQEARRERAEHSAA
jgi:transcriptional regulator with XRE-family HTH domain